MAGDDRLRPVPAGRGPGIPELQHGNSILLQGMHKSLHKLFVNRPQRSRRECKALRGLKNRFLVRECRTRCLHIYILCALLRLEEKLF